MNKFTDIVVLTYFQFIQMPIIETNFGMICIQTNMWWKSVMDDWNLDEKSLNWWQKYGQTITSVDIFVDRCVQNWSHGSMLCTKLWGALS